MTECCPTETFHLESDYMKKDIRIRIVEESDVPALIEWFSHNYSDNLEAAKAQFKFPRVNFLATHSDDIAGFITIGMSLEKNMPYIKTLEVFKPYRRRGVATRLMDVAEDHIAQNMGGEVVLWVPLNEKFGPAQRLYAKRGYIPDGSGALKDGIPIKRGETVTFDNVLLCLVKRLKSS